MPAYRERVYICPNQNGQPCWIMDFPMWWDRRAFLQKYSTRMIDTGNPFNVDYGLLLTGWEAIEWDKQSREQFAQDLRSQEVFFVDALQQWESYLRKASWIIVESYEWESGLS